MWIPKMFQAVQDQDEAEEIIFFKSCSAFKIGTPMRLQETVVMDGATAQRGTAELEMPSCEKRAA